MDQSELEAKTCYRRQARENMQPAPSAGKFATGAKRAQAKSRLVFSLLLIGWKYNLFALIGWSTLCDLFEPIIARARQTLNKSKHLITIPWNE